jgi:hypothetical protein
LRLTVLFKAGTSHETSYVQGDFKPYVEGES